MLKVLLIYLFKILYSPLWLLALIVLLLVKGYNIAFEESNLIVDEALKCWKDYWVLDDES